MKFSVIVPTCDRPDMLAACLRQLAPAQQTLPAESYEVLVSDDGTTSLTEGMIQREFPWARCTTGPRRGPAANRNHGAVEASGEWVVFIDDDCVPTAGWLQAYATALLKAPAIQVLEGCTLASGVRGSIDMEAPINTHGGFLWSCNFAIRRELFLGLGGFDTGFPGPAMEDVEFRERLREQGVPFVFVPDAVVHHPWRKRKGHRFIHVYARSVDYFVEKHPRQKRRFGPRFLTRVLVGQIWRNTGEAFRVCGGRGLFRTVWLEFYAFVLLSWRGFRR